MKNLALATIALTVALAACNKSDDKKADAPPADPIPNSLSGSFGASGSGAGSGNAEARDGVSAILKLSELKIPGEKLVFNNYQSDANKQKALNRLDGDGKANLEKIKSDCTLTPESSNITSADEKTKTAVIEARSSIKGANCPVSVEMSRGMKVVYSSIDKENNLMSGDFEMKEVRVDSVVSDALKAQVAIHSTASLMNAKGKYHNFRKDNSGEVESGGMHTTGEAKVEITLKDQTKIPVTVKLEAIEKKNLKLAQALFTFATAKGNVTIYIKAENDKKEYQLDGQSLTEDEFNSKIGLLNFDFGNL